MSKLTLLLALLFVITGCSGGGVTKPCTNEDQDPTGICASSHSHTYGGG